MQDAGRRELVTKLNRDLPGPPDGVGQFQDPDRQSLVALELFRADLGPEDRVHPSDLEVRRRAQSQDEGFRHGLLGHAAVDSAVETSSIARNHRCDGGHHGGDGGPRSRMSGHGFLRRPLDGLSMGFTAPARSPASSTSGPHDCPRLYQ